MNTVWSDQVQGIDCLYTSRSLRFSDRFKEKFIPFFAISEHARILEIGCGPGALSEALARWYPTAKVHGTDRDSNFISYAKEQVPAATFSEEDATALSFADESFDVTVSNTVFEHIEPSRFFGEQYRVLKKGGICLLLSARKGVQHFAPCVTLQSDLEKEIWARVEKKYDEIDRHLGICAYPMNEQQLPKAMEQYGFRNVSVEYAISHFTPDASQYDRNTAYAIINSERASNLNAINTLKNKVPDLVTGQELLTLIRETNAKYDRRLALYDQGEKQWDTYLSLTMMVRGVK